jgi:hypothetical protein
VEQKDALAALHRVAYRTQRARREGPFARGLTGPVDDFDEGRRRPPFGG